MPISSPNSLPVHTEDNDSTEVLHFKSVLDILDIALNVASAHGHKPGNYSVSCSVKEYDYYNYNAGKLVTQYLKWLGYKILWAIHPFRHMGEK